MGSEAEEGAGWEVGDLVWELALDELAGAGEVSLGRRRLTCLGQLELEWELGLYPGPALRLRHTTPGLPAGLPLPRHSFHLETRGGGLVALRRHLLKSLVSGQGLLRVAGALGVPRYGALLHDGGRVRLTARLELWESQLGVEAVAAAALAEAAAEARVDDGVLGRLLWRQLAEGEPADLEFRCGDGRLVRGHRAVLAAQDRDFGAALRAEATRRGRPASKWCLRAMEVPSPALRSALGWLYRGPGGWEGEWEQPDSAPAATLAARQALEAGRMLGLERPYERHWEARLICALRRWAPLAGRALPALWDLAQDFRLPLLHNLVLTRSVLCRAPLRPSDATKLRPRLVPSHTAPPTPLTNHTLGASTTRPTTTADHTSDGSTTSMDSSLQRARSEASLV